MFRICFHVVNWRKCDFPQHPRPRKYHNTNPYSYQPERYSLVNKEVFFELHRIISGKTPKMEIKEQHMEQMMRLQECQCLNLPISVRWEDWTKSLDAVLPEGAIKCGKNVRIHPTRGPQIRFTKQKVPSATLPNVYSTRKNLFLEEKCVGLICLSVRKSWFVRLWISN